MVKLSLPHPVPIKNPTSPFRNFNFMRPIKIVGSDTDLHDYQVRIHLDRSNFPLEKCKPDGSDIRFRDDSGEILPYWIERWNAAEGVIWCKIPFIPAESSKFIWMIYGNPNAKSESNGNAVFEMFDVQDIVGFWHMDEPQWTGATGEVKDETGVNHGTAHGGATTTSDAKYGRAGYFDGSNDYVEVPDSDSLDITDAGTLMCWFNTTRNDMVQSIISKQETGLGYDTPYALRLYNDQFMVRLGDGSNLQDVKYTGVEINEWYFFVGTWDGDKVKLYVNGELKTEELQSITPYVNDAPLLLCAEGPSHALLFSGKIDELRIYKRALSPTEVQILYNNYMQKMGSYFNVRKYVTPAPVVIV